MRSTTKSSSFASALGSSDFFGSVFDLAGFGFLEKSFRSLQSSAKGNKGDELLILEEKVNRSVDCFQVHFT